MKLVRVWRIMEDTIEAHIEDCSLSDFDNEYQQLEPGILYELPGPLGPLREFVVNTNSEDAAFLAVKEEVLGYRVASDSGTIALSNGSLLFAWTVGSGSLSNKIYGSFLQNGKIVMRGWYDTNDPQEAMRQAKIEAAQT